RRSPNGVSAGTTSMRGIGVSSETLDRRSAFAAEDAAQHAAQDLPAQLVAHGAHHLLAHGLDHALAALGAEQRVVHGAAPGRAAVAVFRWRSGGDGVRIGGLVVRAFGED